jgi:hypothetical protein
MDGWMDGWMDGSEFVTDYARINTMC